jgi:hypothetical protein
MIAVTAFHLFKVYENDEFSREAEILTGKTI